MRVIVKNMIRVQEPTADLKGWCLHNLVIPNPEYAKKERMHFWVGNTPKTLSLCGWDGYDLILPYGCLSHVLLMFDITDVLFDFAPAKHIDFQCKVPLYDYQEEAMFRLAKAQYGILQSPAGSGKTQIGIALAAKLGVRTLWLTHTKDLLNQSKKRAEQYMDNSLIGTITEGKVNIGKGITFATIQTMCNLDLPQYENVWDCIIVDECHRVAGTPTAVTQFSKVLNALSARHKYGLSATVHRSDGLIAATYALLGKVVYEVPKEAVADKIMTVSVLPRRTNVGLDRSFLDTDGTILYAKLITYLTENSCRNHRIICDLMENQKHFNLILSDRLSHLKFLMSHLPPDMNDLSVMIDGSMVSKKAKAQREQALEDMRTGKKRYLFATYSLAKEGLDIPRLDRLYLTTPQKDYAIITQSIGRIDRTFDGKEEPVVYDYVDNNIQYLLKAYKKRCTTYRKCGCRFIE